MTPREFSDRLAKRARRAGITIDPSIEAALTAYYRLLELWNQKVNLTAFSLSEVPDEAIDRLLIEPLVATRHFHASAHTHLMDVGSGGGSPAIPLKIAVPNLTLVMVESKTRKCAFLREAVRQLGLTGATVETARAEDLLARPELHEALDAVSVRAVRIEARLLIRLQAFLRTGGRILLFRGHGSEAPPPLAPPLVYEATFPLVEALHSRLVVLRKML
jgi:16S rRNA (guanine527-N7)-methyltransferase